MERYGFDKVYLQEIMVPHWERGTKESGWIRDSKGRLHKVNMLALGGSVGTHGILEGEIVEFMHLDDLKKAKRSQVEGKIVFLNQPMNEQQINTFRAYGGCWPIRGLGGIEAGKLGAKAVIIRSLGMPIDEHPHTGSMQYADSVEKIPAAAVSTSDAEKIYRSVEFLIDFFRSTPSSALIPLFLLIFGITDVNKIAIATFAAILLIIFNSAYGVMNAKKTRVNAAITMGIPKRFIFKDVLFMESLPQTFVGLRTGISMALVIVIVAEMFIGSTDGLGHRIIDAQQVFNVKEMYSSILITGALGYGLNLVFLLVEKRIVHWSGKA